MQAAVRAGPREPYSLLLSDSADVPTHPAAVCPTHPRRLLYVLGRVNKLNFELSADESAALDEMGIAGVVAAFRAQGMSRGWVVMAMWQGLGWASVWLSKMRLTTGRGGHCGGGGGFQGAGHV